MRRSFAHILFLSLLLLWSGLFLSRRIDLSTADLGRHLENGRLLLHAPWGEKLALLKTNFYSYTLPDAPFVNHHWLTGLVFFLIYSFLGFVGLSAFYVALSLLTIFLFWRVAKKFSDTASASVALLILIPLIVGRAEVRPEVWSYLLSGVFLNVLLFRRYLWILPLLMILWVNLHIGFVFGFLILGAFGLEELWKLSHKEANEFAALLRVGVLMLLAALVNPFGWKLLFYPFTIFQNYGYRIVENQSVFFLLRLGFTQGMHFGLLALSLAALVGGLVCFLATRRKARFVVFFLPGALAVFAALGIRHMALYALFAVPALAVITREALAKIGREGAIFLLAIGVAAILALQGSELAALSGNFGWGLMPGALAAEEFFVQNRLSGPIFNNYDIGSYLIFSLFPEERVYVDNRPEAYSVDFFAKDYIAPQEDEDTWHTLEKRDGFNVIFFSYRDYTPWAQAFLGRRLADPAWAPVYVDQYDIIFLRRGVGNDPFIAAHEIPRSAFGISSEQ